MKLVVWVFLIMASRHPCLLLVWNDTSHKCCKCCKSSGIYQTCKVFTPNSTAMIPGVIQQYYYCELCKFCMQSLWKKLSKFFRSQWNLRFTNSSRIRKTLKIRGEWRMGENLCSDELLSTAELAIEDVNVSLDICL